MIGILLPITLGITIPFLLNVFFVFFIKSFCHEWESFVNFLQCGTVTGKSKKDFSVFGTGTEKPKNLSRCLGQEWEIHKSFTAEWEQENHAFPFRNILERKFPLMPVKVVAKTNNYV